MFFVAPRALSYINATHMGVRKLGMRYGMYTDDTQTALALATSLVENQALDPGHAGLAA
jgi:ADP-ribosylglycohydrolase